MFPFFSDICPNFSSLGLPVYRGQSRDTTYNTHLVQNVLVAKISPNLEGPNKKMAIATHRPSLTTDSEIGLVAAVLASQNQFAIQE